MIHYMKHLGRSHGGCVTLNVLYLSAQAQLSKVFPSSWRLLGIGWGRSDFNLLLARTSGFQSPVSGDFPIVTLSEDVLSQSQLVCSLGKSLELIGLLKEQKESMAGGEFAEVGLVNHLHPTLDQEALLTVISIFLSIYWGDGNSVHLCDHDCSNCRMQPREL